MYRSAGEPGDRSAGRVRRLRVQQLPPAAYERFDGAPKTPYLALQLSGQPLTQLLGVPQRASHTDAAGKETSICWTSS